MLAFRFEGREIRWFMLRDSPWQALIFMIAALVCLAACPVIVITEDGEAAEGRRNGAEHPRERRGLMRIEAHEVAADQQEIRLQPGKRGNRGLDQRPRRRRTGLSLDRIPERSCVVANADIPRHDRSQRGRLAEPFRSGEVNRVKGANGFDRKPSPHAVEDLVCNGDQKASPFESSKGPHR
jgi:hypothetical protein